MGRKYWQSMRLDHSFMERWTHSTHRLIFMDDGGIVEQSEPTKFFSNPQLDRTRLFFRQIIHH